MTGEAVSAGPVQSPESIFSQIDALFDNPDYRITQFDIFRDGQAVFPNAEALQTALDSLWWVKFTQSSEAQKLFNKLVEAEFIPLLSPEGNSQIEAIKLALQEAYLKAVQERAQEQNPPQAQVRNIREQHLPLDVENRSIYDEKAPWYRSYFEGFTPEKMASLLEVSLNQLAALKILLAGIGPGDLVRWSLPEEIEPKPFGLDISLGMILRMRELGINIPGVVANMSHPPFDTENSKKRDVIIADYFLDIAERPVTALQNMAAMLPQGGKLLVSILIPINQVGANSLLTGEVASVSVSEQENIGNTGNPWSDIKKLQEICLKLGLKLKTYTLTNYLQFDGGREKDGAGKKDSLPLEIRPGLILAFEKI